MANKPYPLIDQVRVERGDEPLLMPDSATSVVRRRLLHGETVNTGDDMRIRSAVTKAVADLKKCGYTFESTLAPSRGHGAGRPSVLHRVTNPKHVPTPPARPEPTSTPTTNTTSKRAQGLAALMRTELLAGRAVGVEFAEAHGFTRDQLHKTVHNLQYRKLKSPLKLQRLTDGRYVLKGKPPKSTSLVRRDGHRLEQLDNEPMFDLAALPKLGGGLQVRGLTLDDDDSIRIALRNGNGTWVAKITGLVAQ